VHDIYFLPEYGKLCELVDGGTCHEFVLKDECGTVRNQFIKRPTPYLIDGVQYYDIVTPYGYGGPMIYEATDKAELLKRYEAAFAEYCAENNIVCEFVRFHPIYQNYKDFEPVYHGVFSRNTVGTNLKDFEDPVQKEFAKSARREVRRAGEAGVECVIVRAPENLDAFRRLYEETMGRNNASAMYYFPSEYYTMLTTDLRENVLEIQVRYNGEIIASEIYFICGDLMHAHLLGSSQALFELGGGAILEAAAARWGKENGFRYIHHGGGRSSDPNDSLYMYKIKFGKHTRFDFYIGKKVWLTDVYESLVARRLQDGPIENEGFFPIYRG